MKERVNVGPIDERDLCKIEEAVCVQTEKVYDSCRERDCIEDLEVFGLCQKLVNKAIDVTCREVEVEDVVIDIEPLKFKRGFFTVTVSFVFKVCVDLIFRNEPPKTRCGVAIFTKKTILFGSEGRVKIFRSKFKIDKKDKQLCEQDNRPNGIVEVAEPICLAARIEEESEATTLSVRDINIIQSIINFIQKNEADVDIDIDGNNNDVDVNVEQTNVINIGRQRGGGAPLARHRERRAGREAHARRRARREGDARLGGRRRAREGGPGRRAALP